MTVVDTQLYTEKVQSLPESVPVSDATASRSAAIFGKFILLKKLATGGMGEILLAKLQGPVGFEKLLVIKRILEHHSENQSFVDMFLDEARLAARLSHANIVKIYEMGQIDGHYYLAMEYVHGKSLREVIHRARARGEYIHPGHVVEIMSGACAGLAYAHAARSLTGEPLGIIHRDINPQNLLVSYNGEIKVIDFGIAKAETSQQQTEIGTIKGKFVYMSPEQSSAQALDPRSDLFSAGICLYECLALRNPFARNNIVLSVDAIQREPAPPITETRRTLAPFAPVLDKALAKARDERYADCAELQRALSALLVSGEVEHPAQSLASYMQDLFADEIARDTQMLAQLGAVSDADLAEIGGFQEREHRSGPHGSTSSRIAAAPTGTLGRNVATELVSLPQAAAPSRHIFARLLAGVVVVTLLAVGAVLTLARRETPSNFAPGAQSSTPAPIEPKSPEPAAVAVPATDPPAATTEGPSDAPTDRQRRTARQAAAHRAAVASANSAWTLLVSSVPPVAVTRDGKAVGQTVRLSGTGGRLAVGSGRDAQSDPFAVVLSYHVQGKDLRVDIDATPWAIVRETSGIGLGKTPVKGVDASNGLAVELINPKEGRQLRLTLRLSR